MKLVIIHCLHDLKKVMKLIIIHCLHDILLFTIFTNSCWFSTGAFRFPCCIAMILSFYFFFCSSLSVRYLFGCLVARGRLDFPAASQKSSSSSSTSFSSVPTASLLILPRLILLLLPRLPSTVSGPSSSSELLRPVCFSSSSLSSNSTELSSDT